MDPLRPGTPLLRETQTPKRIQTKESDSGVSQEYSRHQEKTPNNVVKDGQMTGVLMFDYLCQKNMSITEKGYGTKVVLYQNAVHWLYQDYQCLQIRVTVR